MPSGQGSPGDYGLLACLVFETAATFIFVVAILGVTQAPDQLAGLVIGLTLVVIHIVGIQVTGVSVNPARSLGPAVWVGLDALSQLWLFIAAPMIGAGLAGWAFRVKLLSERELKRPRLTALAIGRFSLSWSICIFPTSAPRVAQPSDGDCIELHLWTNGFHTTSQRPPTIFAPDHPLRQLYPQAHAFLIGWGDEKFYRSDVSELGPGA